MYEASMTDSFPQEEQTGGERRMGLSILFEICPMCFLKNFF
jgi:hypothetical protein